MTVHPIYMGMSWAYLMEQPSGLLLVDAGLVRQEEKVFQVMREIGRDDLKAIYLTHAHLDHVGSAAAIKQRTKAPIIIHKADAEDLRLGKTNIGTASRFGQLNAFFLPIAELFIGAPAMEPDVIVDESDTLASVNMLGEVLHIPGHTAGSTALIVQSDEKRLAFAGDLLTASSRGARLQQMYATDWGVLPHSLRKLHAAQPDLIYTGHGSQNPISFEALDSLVNKLA